jgi:hypothetical protein
LKNKEKEKKKPKKKSVVVAVKDKVQKIKAPHKPTKFKGKFLNTNNNVVL